MNEQNPQTWLSYCESREYSPSLSMPTPRHFWKRQAWHALRRLLVISQSPLAGQEYSIFPVIKRIKQSSFKCDIGLIQVKKKKRVSSFHEKKYQASVEMCVALVTQSHEESLYNRLRFVLVPLFHWELKLLPTQMMSYRLNPDKFKMGA